LKKEIKGRNKKNSISVDLTEYFRQNINWIIEDFYSPIDTQMNCPKTILNFAI